MSSGGASHLSRGYAAKHAPHMIGCGVASNLLAIAVFTVFVIDERVGSHVFRHSSLLWAAVPMLSIWLYRAWRLAVTNNMNDDVVVFVFQDKILLLLGGAMTAIFWLAR